MSHDAAKRLAEHVREECGEALRTVVVLTDDGWEGVYLRDDLREDYTHEEYERAVEAFRHTQLTAPGTDNLPLGKRHVAVFYHEDAFVLQFRYSETETILVSVKPEAGRDLLGFIENCRQVVQRES